MMGILDHHALRRRNHVQLVISRYKRDRRQRIADTKPVDCQCGSQLYSIVTAQCMRLRDSCRTGEQRLRQFDDLIVGRQVSTERLARCCGVCTLNASTACAPSDCRRHFYGRNRCDEDLVVRRRGKQAGDPSGACLVEIAFDKRAAIKIGWSLNDAPR